MALLKSTCDPNQPKITDFFDIVNKISKLAEETPEINTIMRSHPEEGTDRISPLLNRLLLNAKKNSSKLPQQR